MKILCLGSLNVDRVYAVPDFVQPGETLSAQSFAVHAGGKGLNQAIALRKAGADVAMAGLIGADGGLLLQTLADQGVDTRHVQTLDAVPSGHAVIQVTADGRNCILVCGGTNQCVDEAFVDAVYSQFSRGDMVLLQNEITCLSYAIDRAYALGLTVALNPSPMTEALAQNPALAHVRWLVLNEVEGRQLTGETAPEALCAAIHARYPLANIVLTLGEKGCLFYDGEQTLRHGVYETSVVDTTAAGDAFTGYFLAATAEGLSTGQVLELASKAAALTISKPGASVSIPNRAAVERAALRLKAEA